jgi:hypothetical protein
LICTTIQQKTVFCPLIVPDFSPVFAKKQPFFPSQALFLSIVLLTNIMKRLVLAVLFICIFSTAGKAALLDWNIDISLNDDRTSDWNVTLLYSEPVVKSDYFVLATIKNYEVFADGVPVSCKLEKEIGTSIVCADINARNVTYSFSTNAVVTDILDNYHFFTHRLPATQLTDKYTVTVRLPFGNVLVEPDKLRSAGLKPYEPETGQQGSDGRRIILTWSENKPPLGETLNIAAVYEQVSTREVSMFGAILGALIVAFFIVMIFFFRRRPMSQILPVLGHGERQIMQILLRENGSVDQRQIVKETDFSKAKVSRLISDMEGRGIVEKISKGRKNIIRIKKGIKVEKSQKQEDAKNKGEITI